MDVEQSDSDRGTSLPPLTGEGHLGLGRLTEKNRAEEREEEMGVGGILS